MTDFKKDLLKNVAIISALIIVFAAFFILFRLNIIRQSQTVSELNLNKYAFSKSAQDLSVLIKEWDGAKKYKEIIKELIPSKDTLVSLPNEFQSIAQKNKVVLNFSFGPETKIPASQDLSSVTFTAIVDGEESGLVSFLQEIEKNYYSLKISSLEVIRGNIKDEFRLSFLGEISFVNK